MRQLDNWLESYLELTTKSEAPYLFHKWLGISTIAACLQRKCYMQWDTEIYPNLYILILGPSGMGRKGTAMKIAEYMLKSAGVVVASEAITREALIQEMSESLVVDQDIETGMPYMHSSLTVFSTELGVFIAGDQGVRMLPDLCKWFDCEDPFRYRTISRGKQTIEGTWVNLVGATTPSSLREALPNEIIGGGFLSRCILVYGERGKKVAYPVLSKEEVKLKDTLVKDLEEIRILRGKYMLSPEYLERYTDWYEGDSDPPILAREEIFAPYLGRRSLHLRKVSMILSASRSNSLVLEEEDFENSLSFLEEVEKEMPKVFRGYGKSRLQEMMSPIMKTVGQFFYGNEELTVDSLYQLYYKDLIYEDFKQIVLTMKKIGYITYTPTVRNGSTIEVIKYAIKNDLDIDENEARRY